MSLRLDKRWGALAPQYPPRSLVPKALTLTPRTLLKKHLTQLPNILGVQTWAESSIHGHTGGPYQTHWKAAVLLLTASYGACFMRTTLFSEFCESPPEQQACLYSIHMAVVLTHNQIQNPLHVRAHPKLHPTFLSYFFIHSYFSHFHFHSVTCISGANKNLSGIGGIEMNEWMVSHLKNFSGRNVQNAISWD